MFQLALDGLKRQRLAFENQVGGTEKQVARSLPLKRASRSWRHAYFEVESSVRSDYPARRAGAVCIQTCAECQAKRRDRNIQSWNPFRAGCSKRLRCKAERDAGCETYLVCTSQRRASGPTQQVGLFQQPARPHLAAARISPFRRTHPTVAAMFRRANRCISSPSMLSTQSAAMTTA